MKKIHQIRWLSFALPSIFHGFFIWENSIITYPKYAIKIFGTKFNSKHCISRIGKIHWKKVVGIILKTLKWKSWKCYWFGWVKNGRNLENFIHTSGTAKYESSRRFHSNFLNPFNKLTTTRVENFNQENQLKKVAQNDTDNVKHTFCKHKKSFEKKTYTLFECWASKKPAYKKENTSVQRAYIVVIG